MLAKSLQAAAGNAGGDNLYIEDVFSTYLYTGNGSTQTITNGIDLAGEGGMVWTKSRSAAKNNGMWDTVRGAGTSSASPNNKTISSNGLNLSAFYSTDYLSSFNSTGFAVTYGDATYSVANQNSTTYASWSFRKQPKFFDIQTWTGNGTAGKTISHDLGSVPGCIMVLCTTANYSWFVYHRSANAGGNTTSLQLNSTAAAVNEGNAGIQNLTSTTFQLGSSGAYSTRLNDSGQTYIAYLFAHDAGGFGDDGAQNVISCGSFTTASGGAATVNLGYEPQWLIAKKVSGAGEWYMVDSMRGFSVGSPTAILNANSSSAEYQSVNFFYPTATGFTTQYLDSSSTYIYIAIRRGPMKTPEAGTEVFSPNVQNASSTIALTTGFPVDLIIGTQRSRAIFNGTALFDRLRGTKGVASGGKWLNTRANDTENSDYGQDIDRMTGFLDLFFNTSQSVASSTVYWSFKRAPKFLDILQYTGTGANQTITHNLTAVPELIFIKDRDFGLNGKVYAAPLGNTKYLQLFSAFGSNGEDTSSTVWNNTSPTSTAFTVGSAFDVNYTSAKFMAYLFSSVDGVSKVGSYTGSGGSQTINCGFTSGARFILIKRTNTTGDWWIFDTVRGIVSANDPALRINTTDAETTTVDSIDPDSSGFIVVQNATTNINVNGASYIFLAIA